MELEGLRQPSNRKHGCCSERVDWGGGSGESRRRARCCAPSCWFEFSLVGGWSWISVERDFGGRVFARPQGWFPRGIPHGTTKDQIYSRWPRISPPTIFHLPHLRGNTVYSMHTFSWRCCHCSRIKSLPRKGFPQKRISQEIEFPQK